MSVAATVIVPTHDHGPTLLSSLGSVVAQTLEDIEVFVIGDGVPDVTREIVGALSRLDERVRFFDHPKGPRHGELYRHEALAQARGEIVCYLSDDDVWFPEHVETMQEALVESDFVGAHAVHVTPTGDLLTWPSDLSLPWFRERMLVGDTNFVPLSCAAHTLDVYRRLPDGWSPAPLSSATDLFMWRKVLSLPGLRARSTTLPTVVHLPSTLRRGWTADARVAELEPWAVHVADPEWRREFRAEVFDIVRRQAAAAEAAAGALMETRTWRFRRRLLDAPALGAAASALARRGAQRAGER
jgi:GalNAc5-diNAcBac-PP-undecaprenol beta-1,3-glucosyltransferase